MLLKNRVFFSDNGVLTGYSTEMNSLSLGSMSLAMVAGEDYIYIGSEAPFNHRFMEIVTPDAGGAKMKVEYFNNKEFVDAVEVIDQTKGMTQNGNFIFIPNKKDKWTARDTEDINELDSLIIYDLYWARVSFDINVSFEVNFLGHRFSDDNDLGYRYPELIKAATLSAFKTGKTNWDDQHIIAAQAIIEDLQKKQVIDSANQILSYDKFTPASVHYVARLIFAAFGDNYKDDFDRATEEYRDAINLLVFDVDRDSNATLDGKESQIDIGIVRR